MEDEQESDMSAQVAEVLDLERVMLRFCLFNLCACIVFGLVHDFGNSVVSRRLMVNPSIATFGFGYNASISLPHRLVSF